MYFGQGGLNKILFYEYRKFKGTTYEDSETDVVARVTASHARAADESDVRHEKRSAVNKQSQ